MSNVIATGNGKIVKAGEAGKVVVEFQNPEIESIEMQKAEFMKDYPVIFPEIYKIGDHTVEMERLDTNRPMAVNGLICAINREDDHAGEFFDSVVEYLEDNESPSATEFLDILNEGFFVDKDALARASESPEVITYIEDLLELLPKFLATNPPLPQQEYLDLCNRQFGYTGSGKLKIFDW
jgi:hypothetical protein